MADSSQVPACQGKGDSGALGGSGCSAQLCHGAGSATQAGWSWQCHTGRVARRTPDAGVFWMTSLRNSTWKNLAARHAVVLIPLHFFPPNLTLQHVNTLLKLHLLPEVSLINNSSRKCIALAASVLLPGHPSNIPAAFPNKTLLVFLREQHKILLEGTICRRGG